MKKVLSNTKLMIFILLIVNSISIGTIIYFVKTYQADSDKLDKQQESQTPEVLGEATNESVSKYDLERIKGDIEYNGENLLANVVINDDANIVLENNSLARGLSGESVFFVGANSELAFEQVNPELVIRAKDFKFVGSFEDKQKKIIKLKKLNIYFDEALIYISRVGNNVVLSIREGKVEITYVDGTRYQNIELKAPRNIELNLLTVNLNTVREIGTKGLDYSFIESIVSSEEVNNQNFGDIEQFLNPTLELEVDRSQFPFGNVNILGTTEDGNTVVVNDQKIVLNGGKFNYVANVEKELEFEFKVTNELGNRIIRVVKIDKAAGEGTIKDEEGEVLGTENEGSCSSCATENSVTTEE